MRIGNYKFRIPYLDVNINGLVLIRENKILKGKFIVTVKIDKVQLIEKLSGKPTMTVYRNERQYGRYYFRRMTGTINYDFPLTYLINKLKSHGYRIMDYSHFSSCEHKYTFIRYEVCSIAEFLTMLDLNKIGESMRFETSGNVRRYFRSHIELLKSKKVRDFLLVNTI